MTLPLERWDDRDVRLLIACYSKFKRVLGKGKTAKKDVFAKIAADFNATSNKIVTADQCLRKWSKLEEKQKEVETITNSLEEKGKLGNFTTILVTVLARAQISTHYSRLIRLSVLLVVAKVNVVVTCLTCQMLMRMEKQRSRGAWSQDKGKNAQTKKEK